MDVGSKLDKIIDSQAGLKTQQAVLCRDMKHLIADNVEFKEGMNKNVAAFKKDYYKTKATVQKHGIWFSVGHFLTVTLLGLLGYKNM